MSHLLKLATFVVGIWRCLVRGLRRRSQIAFSWPIRIRDLWCFLLRLPSNFYPRLKLNILLGLSIVALAFIFHNSPSLTRTEDEGIDKLMRVWQKIIPHNDENPPFVFLDIDNQTHQAWGAPLFTPRNRVHQMIDAAVQAKARLIIVDIDLSRETPMEGLEKFTQGLQRHPYDQALYDYLKNYAAACSCKRAINKKAVCPPIILIHTFQPTSQPLVTRPSFLDEAVEHSTPYVQWASPLFYRSSDHVVRHWWLWQPACTAAQQPTVIPSVELLAAALVRNGSSQPETFENALQPFQPPDCSRTPTRPLPATINFGQLTVSTGSIGISQRVRYSMPWSVANQPPPPLRYLLRDKAKRPILVVYSAQAFATKSPPADHMKALKGSIVVIGGSYQDGGDIHLTPLGKMPGALILINAIQTLLQHGEIKPLPTGLKILTYLVLIIIISLVLARFGYGWGAVIVGVFVIVILIPASIFAFSYGIWLDFTLPLAIVMHLLPW